MRKLKIGTRGSALAVAQARLVQDAFAARGEESKIRRDYKWEAQSDACCFRY